MIPQEKREAVVRALREGFGVEEFDDIQQITKGRTTSLVFRVVVKGSPYLLKIITRDESPARHYACMRVAAEAQVAPRVLYASVEDKVSITDFVKSEALSWDEALGRMPVVLRTLHALPPFPTAPFNTTCTYLLHKGTFEKGPAVEGFLKMFRDSKALPPEQAEEFFARHAELAAVYRRDEADLVACHNDLFKPDNILFDGRHVWLVDWEAAFLNDRYADLAVVANQLVETEEEERAFLEAYFGAPPDAYQLARLHLMQQLAHLFYTAAFLFPASMSGPIDWSGPVPDYGAYQRRFWAGEVELVERDAKITYGRVHWRRLLDNVAKPRYRESLRIIGR